MGSRGKRKLEEIVLKDVVKSKKPRSSTCMVDGIQKSSKKAVPLSRVKDLRKSEYAVYGCNTMSEKGKIQTDNVKRTHHSLPQMLSGCLSEVKTQNTLQAHQESNVILKKKTVSACDKKNRSQVKLNSKKKGNVHSVQVVQKSEKNEHIKVKPKNYSATATMPNSEENSTPSLTPKNFSSNWKSLQQILQKQKKKPTTHHSPHKKKNKSIKKKPEAKETENVKESEAKIWFDDVDDILIESLKKQEEYMQNNSEKVTSYSKSENRLIKPGSFKGLTKTLAVDCEMVGVGEGGKDSVLARVSVVNHFGQCVYDKFVKPQEKVTDYRTHVSGVRPENLKNAEEFSVVQEEISRMFKDRVLVGHAIDNDLKVLFLSHPKKMIRDTSNYKPFRNLFNGRKPALRKLADKLLMVKVQEGEHNSVQDAQAAMRLYTMYRKDWEKCFKMRWKPKQRSLKMITEVEVKKPV